MTPTTKLKAHVPTRLSPIITRLGAERTKIAILGIGVLVVIGVLAVFTDHLGTALLALLAIQVGIVVLILGLRQELGQVKRSEAAVIQRVDQASARTLADLSRARHHILTAMDQLSERR